MTDCMVFSLPGHEALGERLRHELGGDAGALTVRAFPDGETYVRGETPCEARDAVLAWADMVLLYTPSSVACARRLSKPKIWAEPASTEAVSLLKHF